MTETFGQKRSTVHQVAALGICAVLLGGSAAVQAGGAGQAGGADGPSHTFTIVVDSERDGLAATRCPAINTLGTIAVTVVDTLGRTSIITKRNANDTPVTIADTQTVANFPTICDNGFSSLPSDPSINEKGEVAFQGNLRRVYHGARAEPGRESSSATAVRSPPSLTASIFLAATSSRSFSSPISR